MVLVQGRLKSFVRRGILAKDIALKRDSKFPSLQYGLLTDMAHFERFSTLLVSNSTWEYCDFGLVPDEKRKDWFKKWKKHTNNKEIISIPKWANVQYEKRNLILKQLTDLNLNASSHNLDGVIIFDSTDEPKTKEELTDTLELCKSKKIPMSIFCQVSVEDYEEVHKIEPQAELYKQINNLQPLYFNGFYYLTLDVFEGGTIECMKELQKNTLFPNSTLLTKDLELNNLLKEKLEIIFSKCLRPNYHVRGFGIEEWDELYRTMYDRTCFEEEIRFVQEIVVDNNLHEHLLTEEYISFEGFCEIIRLFIIQYAQGSFVWDMIRSYRFSKYFQKKEFAKLE